MAHPGTLHGALIELLTSYHELNVDFVETVNGAPSPLEFLRFVQKNRPVVFKTAVAHWPAVANWSAEYLRSKMGSNPIQVAETPLGNADSAVVNKKDGLQYFVKPHQSPMPFVRFLDDLQSQRTDASINVVKYAQSQDNNIRKEFGPIAPDVDSHIPWASEALNKLPDAANVWIGNERSISALHKDNYENIYCQIAGNKRFVLISPFEAVCLKERTLPGATYVPSECREQFNIVPDEPPESVPFWPTVDPDSPGGDNPWWQYCRPLHVELDPGSVPAGNVVTQPNASYSDQNSQPDCRRYHKVSQRSSDEGLCCAVNYWYDIEFSGPFFPAVGFARHVGLVALEEGGD